MLSQRMEHPLPSDFCSLFVCVTKQASDAHTLPLSTLLRVTDGNRSFCKSGQSLGSFDGKVSQLPCAEGSGPASDSLSPHRLSHLTPPTPRSHPGKAMSSLDPSFALGRLFSRCALREGETSCHDCMFDKMRPILSGGLSRPLTLRYKFVPLVVNNERQEMGGANCSFEKVLLKDAKDVEDCYRNKRLLFVNLMSYSVWTAGKHISGQMSGIFKKSRA